MAKMHSRLLAAASVATFLIALDSSVLYVAFPAIAKNFPNLSTAELSWVINAYSITLATLLVPSGYLADKFGRKRLFMLGLTVFAAASILCALAPTAGFLVVSRLLQAVGGALVLPASLAAILAHFSGRERMIAVGKWSAAGGLAAAIGPPLGAVLLHVTSWRFIFVINAPICMAGLLLARTAFTDTRGSELAKNFAMVMPSLAFGMGLLAAAILSQDSGYAVFRPVFFAAGFLTLGLSVWRIARQRNLQPILAKPDVLGAAVGTLCFGGAFGSMFIGYNLALIHHFGLSIPLAGLMLTPIPLLSIPVAARAGRLVSRISLQALICLGAASLAAGAALFYIALQDGRFHIALWLAVAVLSSIGIGLCFPLLSIAAVRSVIADYFAIGSALNQSCRQLGTVLGVAATSVVLTGSSPVKFERAIMLLGCLSAGTFISAMMVRSILGQSGRMVAK